MSEFGNIQDWSSANRLHIKLSETKEMITFRPGSRAKLTSPREIMCMNEFIQPNFWQSSLRATRSIERISYGNVSVCLAVCHRRYCIKTTKPILKLLTIW